MLEIYRLIEKVADTKANVLITGESGTGKELIARAIHYHGPRGKGPFEAVNCAALAESILESELFGHEKGAFTDARATRKGLFEISAGGTVFLDEIGELSLNLQAKLLRVLQERTFKRVGGNETLAADVRIIAATNRDLRQEVADGRFREDLFYRLNVVHVPVPPLRDRRDDIPLLTQHFIEKYGPEREGREKLRISPEALRHIYNYSWPGNIRELENAIERAIILCSDDLITPDDLPEEAARANPAEAPPINLQDFLKTGREKKKPAPEETAADLTDVDLDRLFPDDVGLNEALEAVEKKMLRRALEKAGQVHAHAADLLGIKKNVMQYKVKKYPPEELAAESEIDLDLDGAIPPDWDLNEVLEGVEKKLLKRALDKSQGVQVQAAAELGITKRMMQYKMQKYNL
jgi:two-component system NtrC family response regulator